MSLKDVIQRHNETMEPVLAAVDRAFVDHCVDPDSLMETIESHVGWWRDQLAAYEDEADDA